MQISLNTSGCKLHSDCNISPFLESLSAMTFKAPGICLIWKIIPKLLALERISQEMAYSCQTLRPPHFFRCQTVVMLSHKNITTLPFSIWEKCFSAIKTVFISKILMWRNLSDSDQVPCISSPLQCAPHPCVEASVNTSQPIQAQQRRETRIRQLDQRSRAGQATVAVRPEVAGTIDSISSEQRNEPPKGQNYGKPSRIPHGEA